MARTAHLGKGVGRHRQMPVFFQFFDVYINVATIAAFTVIGEDPRNQSGVGTVYDTARTWLQARQGFTCLR
jgi:hypothetical protein